MRYGRNIAAPAAAAAAAGFLVGAAFMYIFDPESGKRRRALVRDKAASKVNAAVEGVKDTAQDLSNRAQGVAAEARGAVSRNLPGSGGDGGGEPRLPNQPF
jgi:gas vesicle protein